MSYRHTKSGLIGAGLVTMLLAGCENLPYDKQTQATVAGGAVGAAAGAALGDSVFATVLGSALGAGAGYLIGAETDWFADRDNADDAGRAIENARAHPATAADVGKSNTGDLNSDGFVTTDELIAMEKAGLSDREIITRLEATNQVFDLTPSQSAELIAAGVSPGVVDRLETVNANARDRALSDATVIGRPAR